MLAPDRREWFDLRGPRKWLGDASPRVAGMLAAPPQHEWLEAVKYWNGGGRAPVWFVVDPARAEHRPGAARRSGALPLAAAVSGAVERGAAERDGLVPRRSAGVVRRRRLGADAGDRRCRRRGSPRAVARADRGLDPPPACVGGALMIGGRSFDPALQPRLTVRVDGRDGRRADRWRQVRSCAFVSACRPTSSPPAIRAPTLKMTVDGERGLARGDRAVRRVRRRDRWSASATAGTSRSSTRAPGARWRWLSERGELQRVAAGHAPVARSPASTPTSRCTSQGESPLTYFSGGSTLTVRSGGRVVFTRVLNADFVDRRADRRSDGRPIVLETDQVVRRRRSGAGEAPIAVTWGCGSSSGVRLRTHGFLARQSSELPNGASKRAQPERFEMHHRGHERVDRRRRHRDLRVGLALATQAAAPLQQPRDRQRRERAWRWCRSGAGSRTRPAPSWPRSSPRL